MTAGKTAPNLRRKYEIRNGTVGNFISSTTATRLTDMSFSTNPVTIKSSHKQHRCDWCNTAIDIGTSYVRWRWYESGDASTVKSHPECLEACNECDLEDSWFDGEQPRGCNCGHDAHCERCKARKLPGRVKSYDKETGVFETTNTIYTPEQSIKPSTGKPFICHKHG